MGFVEYKNGMEARRRGKPLDDTWNQDKVHGWELVDWILKNAAVPLSEGEALRITSEPTFRFTHKPE